MSLATIIPPQMSKRFEEAAKLLSEVDKVRIVSHYDADGIFSAAILLKVLYRKGISFHVTLGRSLDEAVVERLNEETNPAVVFCDLGSGEMELAEGLRSKVVILDHHQTTDDSSRVLQINPHLHDLNGADVLCGSLLSFLLGIAMDERNWDLVPLALAGSIADKQHLGGFKGANSIMVREAVMRGEIRRERGLMLAGKPLESIGSSIEPYFCLSNDELVKLLQGLNIDPNEDIRDLKPDLKKRLTSTLILELVGQGVRSESLESIVGDLYWAEKTNESVNSLSGDVNACARLRQEALGIELCLGDRNAGNTARTLRKQYEEKIKSSLRKLESGDIFKKDNIQFFYSDDPKTAGEVAGIAMQYFLDQEKATFALCVLEKKTKVSCRATKYLVARGLNLAAACKEASELVGGRGGGHTIASGALLPRGKEEKFLEHVDGIITAQYEGGASRAR